MTNTLNDLIKSLENLIEALPAEIYTGSWDSPPLEKEDLEFTTISLIHLLQTRGPEIPTNSLASIAFFIKRIDRLRTESLPYINQNVPIVITIYLQTLQALREQFSYLLPTPDAEALSKNITNQKRRSAAIEARLNELEPQTTDLDSILKRIENAHEAADQLPIDLEALSSAKTKTEKIYKEILGLHNEINSSHKDIIEEREFINSIANNAEKILKKCEHVLRSSTSAGLAAAFQERANRLQHVAYAWVVGLILSLIIAATFGTGQLSRANEILFSGAVSNWTAMLSVILSLLSLGAPVWFAWLSTRQIGQSFRLAEDYAFKASVSRAYEGYRAEAARINGDLEEQLLASALTRLDEQPLRLIEPSSPSSPMAELLHSETIRAALKLVPNFVSEVKDLASRSLPSKTSPKQKPQQSTDADES